MAYIIHNNANNNNNNHKTNSLEILKWKQMLEKILLFLNLSVTLWLFSHSSWFPITLQAFSFFHSKLIILFSNSFYTFLLLNAILLSLFAFSITKNDAVSSNDDNAEDDNDYYNQYLNHTYRESSHKDEDCNNAQPVTCYEGTGTCYDQVREVNVMKDETVTTAVTQTATTAATTTTTTTTTTCYTALSMTSVTGDKASGEKCYRRTQSAGNVERRRMVAELKRFNTGLGRKERSCHVEQLSKEEFNRTVEDFIAKHKRMLLEEQRKTEEA